MYVAVSGHGGQGQCILFWGGAVEQSNGGCNYLIIAGCVSAVGGLIGMCVTFSSVGEGREHGNAFVACWSLVAFLISRKF